MIVTGEGETVFQKHNGLAPGSWTHRTRGNPVQNQHVPVARRQLVLLGFVAAVTLDQTHLRIQSDFIQVLRYFSASF